MKSERCTYDLELYRFWLSVEINLLPTATKIQILSQTLAATAHKWTFLIQFWKRFLAALEKCFAQASDNSKQFNGWGIIFNIQKWDGDTHTYLMRNECVFFFLILLNVFEQIYLFDLW